MSRLIAILRLRLRSLFQRASVDRELERELRFHLDARVTELRREGYSAQDARDRAQREFGSSASIAEQCRDTRRVSFVNNVVQDLRYGARVLRAQPLLLVAATTSIALGIGANLAIFGLANSLLLSKPTARDVDTIVHIRTTAGSHTSYTAWRELAAADVIAGVAGYRFETDMIWRDGESASTVTALVVTANYFDVLGVPIAIGRGFSAQEAAVHVDPRLVVISDSFWRRRLGANPAVAGHTLTLNGETYTVIGVTPPKLRSLPGYGITSDIFLPQSRALIPTLDRAGGHHLQLVGRVRPQQSVAQASAALATVLARIGQTYNEPELGTIREVSYVGSAGQLRDFTEIVLFFGVLLIVTILILAIACANVAGLLLARATTRRREISLRLAIGASRGRLIQQFLTEGLLLCLLGTAGGILLTVALAQVASGIAFQLPLSIETQFSFDTRFAWIAGALVIVSTLLSSLVPALHATRASLSPGLQQAPVVFLHRRFHMRALLVFGQVAISVLLLVTTALFLRNLTLAESLFPGFDADRTLMAQVTFVESRDRGAGTPTVLTLLDRVRALPGVENASVSGGVPLTFRYGGETGTDMRIEGFAQPVRVDYFGNDVGPAYFETMGIRLIRGREFAATDRNGSPEVVVINEEFARRYFQGQEPIGRHLFMSAAKGAVPAQIIGIVANSKYRSIGEDVSAAIYRAYLQRRRDDRFVHVIVRTSGASELMAKPLRDAVTRFDASAAVAVETMSSALRFAFLPSRLGAVLMGALGVLGTLLAMIGLYGVVSYSVSRRTSEIGIRMALGASRRQIARLAWQDGAVLVGAGVVMGLAVALLATSPLRAFLVADLPTRDPISFGATAVALVMTSLVASWGPIRRATRVDPAHALRAE
jgi:predicted permease